ncbi:uncharacterized protein DS421_6g194760 [Arachis hypogaea]|nr:uncharacterized protein DS421_6g194760 [Arachis hypogaea]
MDRHFYTPRFPKVAGGGGWEYSVTAFAVEPAFAAVSVILTMLTSGGFGKKGEKEALLSGGGRRIFSGVEEEEALLICFLPLFVTVTPSLVSTLKRWSVGEEEETAASL